MCIRRNYKFSIDYHKNMLIILILKICTQIENRRQVDPYVIIFIPKWLSSKMTLNKSIILKMFETALPEIATDNNYT